MGIDIGGCLVLDYLFRTPGDLADLWGWWIESLVAMGWDGRSTI